MKFRRIRSIVDRAVQFTALCYWNLILSDDEAKLLSEKDQAEKPKK